MKQIILYLKYRSISLHIFPSRIIYLLAVHYCLSLKAILVSFPISCIISIYDVITHSLTRSDKTESVSTEITDYRWTQRVFLHPHEMIM